jgi:hypothetical protein
MPRRCPPGVLCIDLFYIGVIGLILIGGLYLLYNKPGHMQGHMQGQYMQGQYKQEWQNNITFTTPQKGVGEDVFFDIYKAPLRDDRCFTGGGDIRGAVPINVSTQSCDDAKYRQLGILTRYGGKDETILPLMGRPLFSKRDKWNFYTLNDKNNMIKLPVKVKGKSGTSEYGCDNVYSGDIVFVEGYNDAFKVTTYDNDIVRYLPSL